MVIPSREGYEALGSFGRTWELYGSVAEGLRDGFQLSPSGNLSARNPVTTWNVLKDAC
jgi:hypothetical protein